MKHNKQLLSLVAFLTLLVAWDAQAAIPQQSANGAIALHSIAEIRTEVAKGKPTILAIHNYNCSHCKRSMPKFDKAASNPQNADMLFLKAETGQVHHTHEELGVNATPTLIYYDKGNEIYRISTSFGDEKFVTAPMRKYLKTGSIKPSSPKKMPARRQQRSSSRTQKAPAKKTLQ